MTRLALAALVLGIAASPAVAATMPPVQMTFVDAQDGQPVAASSADVEPAPAPYMNDQHYVEKGCGSPRVFFERLRDGR